MADPGTDAGPEPFPVPPGPPKRRILLPSFVGYRRRWLRVDAIAGLTVWAVLVPESLAYASIAGVSPVVGLYAAPPALLFYALFGSSRHLIVGPMSATAALSAAAVATLATGGPQNAAAFTAALAITTGVLALLGGLLRLGFLANLISEPVLKGFIVGLALTIIIGQVPKLFGISKGEGGFFHQLLHVVAHLGETNGWTLLIGAGSLAVVLGMRRVVPAVPGELVAVIVSVVAANVFDLASHGVALVGHIDPGLPSFGLPHGLEVQDYFATVASAAGIMLVGFAEGLGAAKTYASRHRYDIDANRELLGLGAANVGAGLCSGMVVNGSLSKTAINGAAGARSQCSGLTAAALTVITLLFLTELFEDLPEATLAAIVIAALILLVDFPKLFEYYRLYSAHLGRIYGRAARADFIAAVSAMFGVLIFDTLPGLFIGIAISMALLLYRSSVPYVAVLGRLPGPGSRYGDRSRHADAASDPSVPVLRIEAGLFFANADPVARDVRYHAHQPGVRAVVLDAETIAFVDVTAATMLEELADELDGAGVALAMAQNVGQVRDFLEQTGVATKLRFYGTIDEAVTALTPPRP